VPPAKLNSSERSLLDKLRILSQWSSPILTKSEFCVRWGERCCWRRKYRVTWQMVPPCQGGALSASLTMNMNGNTVCRNVGSHSPNDDEASIPRIFKSADRSVLSCSQEFLPFLCQINPVPTIPPFSIGSILITGFWMYRQVYHSKILCSAHTVHLRVLCVHRPNNHSQRLQASTESRLNILLGPWVCTRSVNEFRNSCLVPTPHVKWNKYKNIFVALYM
jgi:hypothetical protein